MLAQEFIRDTRGSRPLHSNFDGRKCSSKKSRSFGVVFSTVPYVYNHTQINTQRRPKVQSKVEDVGTINRRTFPGSHCLGLRCPDHDDDLTLVLAVILHHTASDWTEVM